MSGEHRRPLTDLVFLRRGPLALRALVLMVLAAATGLGGFETAHLQDMFAARLVAGEPVSSFGLLLARGSGPLTAAAGWLAAVLFGVAIFRLRREPFEPAASLRPVESLSIDQLRRGLRREYTVIRTALTVVILIAAVDASRVISITVLMRRGDRLLAGSFAATVAEAAGLVAAAAVLAWWANNFARRLVRLAVL